MTVILVTVGIVLSMFVYEPLWFDTRTHTTITPINLRKPVTMRQSRLKKLQVEFVSLKIITQVKLIYI